MTVICATRAGALDVALRALQERERSGADLPLALRRFIAHLGEASTTSAMQCAVSRLLDQHGTNSVGAQLPISVGQICALIGARLTGLRPFPRRALESIYSPDTYKPRSGHTGRLQVKNSELSINIPETVQDRETARISAAHEIGHALIHRRDEGYDEATLQLGSSPDEEALAEYGARLLLMPSQLWINDRGDNSASDAVTLKSRADVTMHSAVARLGDPDIGDSTLRGAILWRLHARVPSNAAVHERLTPQWHLCPGFFVPIGKCKARTRSLVSEAAAQPGRVALSGDEEVSIGSFVGFYKVDVFAWGSQHRLVLSLFHEQS